ncbi:hypothetical protein [Enterococcus sp. HY326]|uniref:hypothetical protein n=1 Tax=Enterococcus sp. HY326 TaxID=2971265 RepID=UPI00223F67E0|nr:hypothetical protein [Enterococcus sp. HY326]
MKKEKKREPQEELPDKHFLPLNKAQVGWLVALVLLTFVWLIYPGYGWNHNVFTALAGDSGYYSDDYDYDEDYDYDYEAFALENIDSVGNWTREIYDGVEIATTRYDEDYEVESYYGGDDFETLEEQVGRPRSTYRDDWTGFDTITATWEYSSGNEYISIDITYLEEDGMIISKDIFGYDD